MVLDSIKILGDLTNEFGEGEVTLMKYDFLPHDFELRIVAKNSSVAHQFSTTELELAKVDVFNRIYKQMFAMLKKQVKENVE